MPNDIRWVQTLQGAGCYARHPYFARMIDICFSSSQVPSPRLKPALRWFDLSSWIGRSILVACALFDQFRARRASSIPQIQVQRVTLVRPSKMTSPAVNSSVCFISVMSQYSMLFFQVAVLVHEQFDLTEILPWKRALKRLISWIVFCLTGTSVDITL
jgi:hypothetical protein